MKKIILMIALVFTTSGLFAQDFKIKGAEEPIPFGEMVILKVDGQLPKEAFKVRYDWEITEDTLTKNKDNKLQIDSKPKTRVLTIEEGKTITFGSSIKADKVTARLTVSYVVLIKGKDGTVTDANLFTSGIISQVVQIDKSMIGPTPQPEPNPNPDPPGPPPNPNPQPEPPKPPDVEPVFPLSKFDLAPTAYKEAKALNITNKEKVIPALANAFRSTVAAMNAGVFKTTGQAYQKLNEATKLAIESNGASLDQLQPWDEKIKTLVYDLYKKQKLKLYDDYKEIFNEIADGLEKVK